jgi:hypothetical protein
MTLEDRLDMAAMLAYFWQEKGDITRWCSFDREKVKAEFPEVLKAWDDYQTAYKIMDLVIRNLNE